MTRIPHSEVYWCKRWYGWIGRIAEHAFVHNKRYFEWNDRLYEVEQVQTESFPIVWKDLGLISEKVEGGRDGKSTTEPEGANQAGERPGSEGSARSATAEEAASDQQTRTPGRMSRIRQVQVDVTATLDELAGEFADLDASHQADFFRLVARRFREWGYSASDAQLCAIGKKLAHPTEFEGVDWLRRLTEFAT